MQEGRCLNCEQVLQGSFCHGCGQRASTHRLSIKHFIEHDVVHGIWHIDKGILYTMKGVLTNPGKLSRNYIAGKRAGHFSLVTLLVLLVGLFLFLFSLKNFPLYDLQINQESSLDFTTFVSKSSKWLMLLAVPLVAYASKRIFKKLEYNYTEHLAMSGFFMVGVLCIILVFLGLSFIPIFDTIRILPFVGLAIVIYLFFAYRGATEGLYTKRGYVINFVLQLLLGSFYLFWFVTAMMCVYVFYRYASR